MPISSTDLAPLLRMSFNPLDAADVLQELADARGWFHTSDGAYQANDADRRQRQRTLDEKANRHQQRSAPLATAHDAGERTRGSLTDPAGRYVPIVAQVDASIPSTGTKREGRIDAAAV